MEQRQNSPRAGVINGMEQRRFFEVGGEESGVWLVLDGKRYPPRVICRCLGWSAPKNAALIVVALEAYNSQLYSRFPLDGSVRLNEQSAVKPSGEVEFAAEPKGIEFPRRVKAAQSQRQFQLRSCEEPGRHEEPGRGYGISRSLLAQAARHPDGSS